jgi:hypothetical protein
MHSDTYAHEEPPWAIRLEREVPSEDEVEAQTLDETLLAVEALTEGWVEPLALHLSVGCFDTEALHAPVACRPPQPEWFLRKQELPSGVEARHMYKDPVIDTADALSKESVRTWVARALRQDCPNAPRFIPSWRGLWWPAVRTRMSESLRLGEHEVLRVDCYAGTLSVPLERGAEGAWISGPLLHYVIGPPVDLAAINCDGLVTIDLNVYWTLWIDEPAGRAQVEAAVDRVLALGRGWQRSDDSGAR